jgi:hypothetical protein
MRRRSLPAASIGRGKTREKARRLRPRICFDETRSEIACGSSNPQARVTGAFEVACRLRSSWRRRGSGRMLENESFNHIISNAELIRKWAISFDPAGLADLMGHDWTH